MTSGLSADRDTHSLIGLPITKRKKARDNTPVAFPTCCKNKNKPKLALQSELDRPAHPPGVLSLRTTFSPRHFFSTVRSINLLRFDPSFSSLSGIHRGHGLAVAPGDDSRTARRDVVGAGAADGDVPDAAELPADATQPVAVHRLRLRRGLGDAGLVLLPAPDLPPCPGALPLRRVQARAQPRRADPRPGTGHHPQRLQSAQPLRWYIILQTHVAAVKFTSF